MGSAPVSGFIAENMVASEFLEGIRSFVETNWVGTATPMSPGQTFLEIDDVSEDGVIKCLIDRPIALCTINDDGACNARRRVVLPSGRLHVGDLSSGVDGYGVRLYSVGTSIPNLS